MSKRSLLDELSGCNELDDILEDDELEGIFDDIGKAVGGAVKAVGKAAKGAVKGVAKVAKKVVKSPVTKVLFPVAAVAHSKQGLAIAKQLPGGKQLVDAGTKATALVDKASKLKTGGSAKKSSSSASLKSVLGGASKLAQSLGVKTPAKKPTAAKAATKAAVQSAAVARTALAAPVPMPASAGTVMPAINIIVSPYGQGQTKPAAPVITADDVAKKLEAKLGVNIQGITDVLRKMELQNQATSEHRSIVAKNDFQRQVIERLQRIASKTGS